MTEKILNYKSIQSIFPLSVGIILVVFIFLGIWWTTEIDFLLLIAGLLILGIILYGIFDLHELTLRSDRIEITKLWNKRKITYFNNDKKISIIIPGKSIYSPSRTIILRINDKTVSRYQFSSDWGTQDLYHKTKDFKYNWKIHSSSFFKDYELYLKFQQSMTLNKR